MSRYDQLLCIKQLKHSGKASLCENAQFTLFDYGGIHVRIDCGRPVPIYHELVHVYICMYIVHIHVHVHVHVHITQYGSTVYIGIAMVFVFSPYIRKFSFYFQFQVNSTSDDFTA